MKAAISDRQMEIIEAAGKILIISGISALTIKNLANEVGFLTKIKFGLLSNSNSTGSLCCVVLPNLIIKQ